MRGVLSSDLNSSVVTQRKLARFCLTLLVACVVEGRKNLPLAFQQNYDSSPSFRILRPKSFGLNQGRTVDVSILLSAWKGLETSGLSSSSRISTSLSSSIGEDIDDSDSISDSVTELVGNVTDNDNANAATETEALVEDILNIEVERDDQAGNETSVVVTATEEASRSNPGSKSSPTLFSSFRNSIRSTFRSTPPEPVVVIPVSTVHEQSSNTNSEVPVVVYAPAAALSSGTTVAPRRRRNRYLPLLLALAACTPYVFDEFTQLYEGRLPFAVPRRYSGSSSSTSRNLVLQKHLTAANRPSTLPAPEPVASVTTDSGDESEAPTDATIQDTQSPAESLPVPPAASKDKQHLMAADNSQSDVLVAQLNERRRAALSFVTEAVEKVGPAVLRIDTETHSWVGGSSGGDSTLNPEDELDRSSPPAPTSPHFVRQGQGSGLIFSPDGLILTNAHVVEDATKVTVTLTDGRVFQATVMGADEIVDIAVLKIIPNFATESNEYLNGKNGKFAVGRSSADTVRGDEDGFPSLPIATLGDSDRLSVGQLVVAVGSPGGLDNTSTMGIVSGLERSSAVVGIPHKKVDYIQTDAAINPGNSGGPLVDVATGHVVGINAAIRAHMEGTSFAIPINRVREIMYDLAQGKSVPHGYLGISLATVTPQWARQNNLNNGAGTSVSTKGQSPIPEVYGALVHKVFPRTPAEKGGLKENDIVLEISGQLIQSSDEARRLIDTAPVGKVRHLFCWLVLCALNGSPFLGSPI
jgi:S1-C subfamily serine protease